MTRRAFGLRLAWTVHLILLAAWCTGCVTVREFRGVAPMAGLQTNTHCKVSLACSGSTAEGNEYLALRLPQNTWCVLLHAPLGPDHWVRTNTASGLAKAWLTKGRKPDCAVLRQHRADASAPSSYGKALHGVIEISRFTKSGFHIDVDLADAAGTTALRGQFASYRALWSPLIGPAMLLGFGGARSP